MYNIEEEVDPVEDKATVVAGRYVLPNMRGGDLRGGANPDRRSDENTCRVTNMPQELEEGELREMFSSIGRVSVCICFFLFTLVVNSASIHRP